VRVRPELLGGIRLVIGNVLYDGSVRKALAQLEQQLRRCRSDRVLSVPLRFAYFQLATAFPTVLPWTSTLEVAPS